MNVASLRRIDRWCGLPLVTLLTAFRAIWDRIRPPSGEDQQGILFVKLAEQGSTVLAYPALRRAVESVGRDHVFFLVFRDNRFIVDALGLIPKDNVVCIDASSFFSAVGTSLQALVRLRRLPIGGTIDLEFFARSSAIFTYLSGAVRRVGFHPYAGGGPYRGDLLTHRLVYNPHLHTSQVFYAMVEALSESPEQFPAHPLHPPDVAQLTIPKIQPTSAEIEEVQRLIREVADHPAVPPLILLNVNCSDLLPLRRWATENYVELARRLLDADPELYIGFTGAPNERAEAEQVARQVASPRAVSFAGRTTLRELLALYDVSRVLVTNDSGPAHFATLTRIHVITLFGPETPRLFASPSPRSHAVWSGIACSPCVNAYNNRVTLCRNNLCMQQITVDEVFARTCAAFETSLADHHPTLAKAPHSYQAGSPPVTG